MAAPPERHLLRFMSCLHVTCSTRPKSPKNAQKSAQKCPKPPPFSGQKRGNWALLGAFRRAAGLPSQILSNPCCLQPDSRLPVARRGRHRPQTAIQLSKTKRFATAKQYSRLQSQNPNFYLTISPANRCAAATESIRRSPSPALG